LSAAVEIFVMGAGIFAIGWAVLNPNANIATRIIVALLGVIALIAGRAFEREHREKRQ
jgi:hypothetical protein